MTTKQNTVLKACLRDNHRIDEEPVTANGFFWEKFLHTDKVPQFILLKWELLKGEAGEGEGEFCKQLEM